MINPNLILTVIYSNVILSGAGNFAKRSRLRSRRDPYTLNSRRQALAHGSATLNQDRIHT